VHLTYHPTQNVAYLRLRDPAGQQVETIGLSDEANVDLAPDGSVYGIELLNANAQLRASDGGRLVFDMADRRVELPLPELAEGQ